MGWIDRTFGKLNFSNELNRKLSPQRGGRAKTTRAVHPWTAWQIKHYQLIGDGKKERVHHPSSASRALKKNLRHCFMGSGASWRYTSKMLASIGLLSHWLFTGIGAGLLWSCRSREWRRSRGRLDWAGDARRYRGMERRRKGEGAS